MNTEDGIKTKAAIRLNTGRSYFEWGNGMQVIRRGKGEVAMTGASLQGSSELHGEKSVADFGR